MSEKTFARYDGTLLTFDMVKASLKAGTYIECIKWLRLVSGKGLKESKDAIDTVYVRENNFNLGTFNYVKAVELFTPYFTNQDEISLEDALKHTIKNWQILGFDSAVQGCKVILNNFSNK